MIARFIGKDGSLGFKKDCLYIIKLKKTTTGHIELTSDDGKYCLYGSMKAVEKNWKLILTVKGKNDIYGMLG